MQAVEKWQCPCPTSKTFYLGVCETGSIFSSLVVEQRSEDVIITLFLGSFGAHTGSFFCVKSPVISSSPQNRTSLATSLWQPAKGPVTPLLVFPHSCTDADWKLTCAASDSWSMCLWQTPVSICPKNNSPLRWRTAMNSCLFLLVFTAAMSFFINLS